MNFKTAGACLLVGSLLLTLTMLLHPSGGSVEYILKIKSAIIISHSLALISLPFLALGFFGFSVALKRGQQLSQLAFIITCFGLVAAMFAAVINGLTLPLFLSKVTTNGFDMQMIKSIQTYGFYLNISLDYVLIAAFALATFIWSVLIAVQDKFPKWVGYYGIFLTLLGCAAGIHQFNFVGLDGFRLFIFGLASWLVAVGFTLFGKTLADEGSE